MARRDGNGRGDMRAERRLDTRKRVRVRFPFAQLLNAWRHSWHAVRVVSAATHSGLKRIWKHRLWRPALVYPPPPVYPSAGPSPMVKQCAGSKGSEPDALESHAQTAFACGDSLDVFCASAFMESSRYLARLAVVLRMVSTFRLV